MLSGTGKVLGGRLLSERRRSGLDIAHRMILDQSLKCGKKREALILPKYPEPISPYIDIVPSLSDLVGK